MKKLRRITSILLITVLSALLISCSTNTSSEPELESSNQQLKPMNKQFTYEDDLFKLTLHIDKLEFRSDEKIEFYSTLEYVGEDDEIKIWHGDPYINYTITGKDFHTGGITLDVLTSTILKNGKEYVYPYIKTGGFSQDDPNADFWREFYKEKDLYLPKGKYKIVVYTDFSLSKEVIDSHYNGKVEIEITVK